MTGYASTFVAIRDEVMDMREKTVQKLFVVFLLVSAGRLAAQDQLSSIQRDAAAMRGRLVELRRDFHKNPELSNREERTAKRIAEHLKALGIPVQTGVARNGVVATIRGSRPGAVVAVRADIDALPVEEVNDVPYRSLNKGVKHACGHDAHTTVALAVAELLWKRRETMNGTVVVFFQPAEEGPPSGEEGGAPLMIKEGFLEKTKFSAMFALHAMPTVEVGQVSSRSGPVMASSDRFKITVSGKQSHGAEPHMGIDPIVVGSQIVMALQAIDSRRINPLEPIVVTIGTFHSGTRFNIVPGLAEMEGTLRTLSVDVRQEARRLIDSISRGVAAAAGASAEVRFEDATANPVLMNDDRLTTFAEASLRKSAGPENVKRDPPRMVSEDFAHFAQKVPSFYYFLGVGNRARGITAGLHTPDFDLDEDALVVGTVTMTSLVLDYLREGVTK